MIYLHAIKIPFGADFANPTRYGFARAHDRRIHPTSPSIADRACCLQIAGKVLPLNLTTPDGVRLGAWQVLPKAFYDDWVVAHGVPTLGPLPQAAFDDALAKYPTVEYLHGNGGTRAQFNRLRVAQMVSAMESNFLIIDYRGFADSTPVHPGEAGLVTDARTAWDYLMGKGVRPADVTVMGQSLGTGVSSALVAQLATEGLSPHALILVAPFSSIFELLATYRLGNLFPLLGPVRNLASVMSFFKPYLTAKFNTSAVIGSITCPILILHAQDDNVIAHTHSKTLAGLLDRAHVTEVGFERLGEWGNVTRWVRPGGGDVVLGEAVVGGHNNVSFSGLSLVLQSSG